ncbi:Isopenicillin N synthase [Parasponia andersonii]|uniref:Isopenicillin N synthase n=1 Tax=Parasponia andersonii TaxID=3476 RepID=A0A2P5D957_PARAD|nr:Isopenicillin N synthase [Parasponia andersonii]
MDFGNSLIVPSVQELAKDLNMVTVPSRYIRLDQNQTTNLISVSSDEIPVVNFQNLLLSGESYKSELARLHSACKDWGFFQLVNHGISSSLVEKVKAEVQDFFNLPMEEKKKYWQVPGQVEGFGQAFVVSEEQKLDWDDIFFLTTLPVDLRKPHLFPKLPLPFRETLDIYSLELKKLAEAIIALMEKALEIDSKEISKLFEIGMQSMRMNYFPPCPQPEQVIGLTPHSDAVGLTILLQVSKVEGLQVKKNGMWVPVKPLPNAFIVNIGDILEMITNGIYGSIEHRVTVNSAQERLSIATFYNPGVDTEIGPAHSLINEQNPELYRRLGIKEYVKGLFARELDGKSYIDVMKL